MANAHSWSAQADFASFNVSYSSSIKRLGTGYVANCQGFSVLYSVSSVLDGTTWNDIVFGVREQIFNNVGLT